MCDSITRANIILHATLTTDVELFSGREPSIEPISHASHEGGSGTKDSDKYCAKQEKYDLRLKCLNEHMIKQIEEGKKRGKEDI